ncbi:hypothetical protein K4K58_012616 [Colletotrichum sp. SAR11_239]|nr:hypothetical protein K4K58_012616 [Colletotrichum sp. SAR11_239]
METSNEKDSARASDQPPPDRDWLDEEEAKARWKVDLALMPLIVLGFFALQIDRANIASALTSTITEDLRITTNEINFVFASLTIGTVDGLITVFIGILFMCLIPPSVGDGSPLVSLGKWSYFTERESHILRQRVILDDPAKAFDHEARVKPKDILDFVKKPKRWLHVLISLSAVCAVHSLITYSPRILRTFEFGVTESNALYSVAPFSAMIVNFCLAYLADRSGYTAPFTLFAASWNIVAYACLIGLKNYGKWSAYAVIVVAGVPYSAVQ